MDSAAVKELLFSLGAELCGVAGLDRFDGAPPGCHPLDIFPACQSVISFACRFPAGALLSPSPAPYTRVRNSITAKVDAITLDFCIEMEKQSVLCVPIPANEGQWDRNTNRWRSILSQKHAAQAAGLGTIGRHSLLITPEYGSMVWLGAVLCGQALEPDALKEDICDGCCRCVEACPVHALDGPLPDQQACWDFAFGKDEGTKVWRIACHRCRDICPYNLGTRRAPLSPSFSNPV